MDLKTKKTESFERALISLEAVMVKDLKDEFFRDSAVQRFEYTIELFWKLLKIVLEADYDISARTPREVIKKACSAGLIDEEAAITILKMLRIRNETSHEYAIEVACILIPELPGFTRLLREIFQEIT